MPQVKHESFTYPYVDGRPLTFIAQIDLAEINQNYIDYLPNEGILLFFYDVEIQVWGFDPKDRPHFKVIYLKEEAYQQQDKPYPENIDILKQSHIKATFIDVPMPVDAEEIDKLELNDLEYDAYCEYASTQIFNHEPFHQMGGYPTPEQGNNMELEAQLVTHGIYCGDPSGYESEEAKELKKDANNWRLLLQIDSDEELGLMWGDMGMLYFWVEEAEAKNGNFDNSWLILQCG